MKGAAQPVGNGAETGSQVASKRTDAQQQLIGLLADKIPARDEVRTGGEVRLLRGDGLFVTVGRTRAQHHRALGS
jgi:hypothetical protein